MFEIITTYGVHLSMHDKKTNSLQISPPQKILYICQQWTSFTKLFSNRLSSNGLAPQEGKASLPHIWTVPDNDFKSIKLQQWELTYNKKKRLKVKTITLFCLYLSRTALKDASLRDKYKSCNMVTHSSKSADSCPKHSHRDEVCNKF
jgi:3-oxoacyl-(acyl-carrier-protein) synthase